MAYLSGFASVAAALYYRETLSWQWQLMRAVAQSQRFQFRNRHISKNIRYGRYPRNRLDVFYPEVGDNKPVMVFVHGGSWASGDKSLYIPIADKFLPEDIVVVLINYGLAPTHTYPYQSKDVARAIDWTFRNIRAYGGNPNNITLVGHSAGAHISSLALFDERFLEVYNRKASDLAGFIGMSGPYDLPDLLEFLKIERGYSGDLVWNSLDRPENIRLASPIRNLRDDVCPVLLLHGEDDDTVPVRSSKQFYSALLETNNPVQLKTYPGVSHAGPIINALNHSRKNPVNVIEDMCAFIKRDVNIAPALPTAALRELPAAGATT